MTTTLIAENMTPGLFERGLVRVSMQQASTDPVNWIIGKRRGNRVRRFNVVTAAWDGWTTLTPADPEYRVPVQPQPSFKEPVTVQPEPQPTETAFDVPPAYNAMNRDTLRKLAAEHNVKGRGTMTKDQLVAALEALDDLS